MYTWGRGSTGLCTRLFYVQQRRGEEWCKYVAGKPRYNSQRQDRASVGNGQGMERSPARVGQIQILLGSLAERKHPGEVRRMN